MKSSIILSLQYREEREVIEPISLKFDEDIRFWIYKSGNIYGGSWKKRSYMCINNDSFQVWSKHESPKTNHSPKYTFFFNRCRVESCDMKENSFKLINVESRESVLLATGNIT
jgi:hypothetical protein